MTAGNTLCTSTKMIAALSPQLKYIHLDNTPWTLDTKTQVNHNLQNPGLTGSKITWPPHTCTATRLRLTAPKLYFLRLKDSFFFNPPRPRTPEPELVLVSAGFMRYGY